MFKKLINKTIEKINNIDVFGKKEIERLKKSKKDLSDRLNYSIDRNEKLEDSRDNALNDGNALFEKHQKCKEVLDQLQKTYFAQESLIKNLKIDLDNESQKGIKLEIDLNVAKSEVESLRRMTNRKQRIIEDLTEKERTFEEAFLKQDREIKELERRDKTNARAIKDHWFVRHNQADTIEELQESINSLDGEVQSLIDKNEALKTYNWAVKSIAGIVNKCLCSDEVSVDER